MKKLALALVGFAMNAGLGVAAMADDAIESERKRTTPVGGLYVTGPSIRSRGCAYRIEIPSADPSRIFITAKDNPFSDRGCRDAGESFDFVCGYVPGASYVMGSPTKFSDEALACRIAGDQEDTIVWRSWGEFSVNGQLFYHVPALRY